ncbi:ribosomal protection-like ABC-F family protein [Christensenella minuta]|uniref:ribosomal protection-like ABC-F family protein n=1 Tax=Christensenella minuta TaxID=626937 RepID=UPI002A8075B5|nr:ABC-F family ATP-binding cassette domain-containing protein [Christensenella minuta]MDY3752404.1 ABC-F family ATP-binding cassette domain-containing protein [Christensenella minuta]
MLASFTDVTVAYGETEILKNVTAAINAGDRIGLIGPNGAGKTTLLNTLVKRIRPEAGTVIHKAGLSIGYLEQDSGLTASSTIIEEMRGVFRETLNARAKMREIAKKMEQAPDDTALQTEYARAQNAFEAGGGYEFEVEIKKILNGMGFADKAYETNIATLSGGEKTRLAIARLLLSDPELLILDEPTNHLDFKTLMWLEDYLNGYRGAVLIVSHDRYFLDKLAKKIWELDEGELTEYTGNYTQYKQLKAEYISWQMKEYEKQSRQIAHMEDYVARNLTRASTAKSAQSRVKQLSRLTRIRKPKTEVRAPSFRFEFSQRPVNDVLEVQNLDLVAGRERKVLATDVNIELKRGTKAAVIGDNGTGKSTLMKRLVAASREPEEGIVFGKNTLVGYYDQENKNMTPEKTVVQEVWDAFPSLLEYGARSMLGRVLITGEEVYKHIGDLSGGERAKVGLALLMCGGYNVLLLDEPTNHLDLPARESLEAALKEYEGTLLFVSHDRYFINALAERIYEITDGKLNEFEGTFDEYRQVKELEEQRAREEAPKTAPQEAAEPARNPRQRRAEEAKRRERISRLEKEIAAAEAREAELDRLIAENPADFELVGECCTELEELKERHEKLLEEWIALD